jgi:hypothetical protein
MIAVRYLTLVALVVWLGAMMGARFADLPGRIDLVGYGCGATIVVGLFVTKFMGPPPHAFAARVAIVVMMLGFAAASTLGASHDVARMLAGANIALGFVLLFWYVRE